MPNPQQVVGVIVAPVGFLYDVTAPDGHLLGQLVQVGDDYRILGEEPDDPLHDLTEAVQLLKTFDADPARSEPGVDGNPG